jgi:hypothetical protein
MGFLCWIFPASLIGVRRRLLPRWLSASPRQSSLPTLVARLIDYVSNRRAAQDDLAPDCAPIAAMPTVRRSSSAARALRWWLDEGANSPCLMLPKGPKTSRKRLPVQQLS